MHPTIIMQTIINIQQKIWKNYKTILKILKIKMVPLFLTDKIIKLYTRKANQVTMRLVLMEAQTKLTLPVTSTMKMTPLPKMTAMMTHMILKSTKPKKL